MDIESGAAIMTALIYYSWFVWWFVWFVATLTGLILIINLIINKLLVKKQKNCIDESTIELTDEDFVEVKEKPKKYRSIYDPSEQPW